MANADCTMQVKRTERHVCRQKAAWLVVLALFVQMLAPFGHALALEVDGDFNYQIICTATGIKQIPIDADGQPLEPRDAISTCPVCYFHGAPALLVPENTPSLTTAAIEVAVEFGLPVQHRSVSLFRTAPNPARAPPLTA